MMSIPRSVKNQMTLDRVYHATADLLQERGYDYLTIRNICEKADVAYSSIYHFFGSKEELIYQYCLRSLKEVVALNPPGEIIPEGDFTSELMWYYFIYCSYLEAEGPAVTQALYANSGKDLFHEVFYDEYIIPILTKGAKDGYLNLKHPNNGSEHEVLMHLVSDLSVLLAGTILNWIRLHETSRLLTPSFALIRIMRRFMETWETPAYRERYLNTNSFRNQFATYSRKIRIVLPDKS